MTYDATGKEIPQRDPAKLYKLTTRNGVNCYVELNEAELAKRAADEAAFAADRAKPRPQTFEERLAALEAKAR